MNNDPAYIYENQQYIEMLFSEDFHKFCDYYNLKDWHFESFILRYVDDWYLHEIGEKFKRSSERIRQILMKMTRLLKYYLSYYGY